MWREELELFPSACGIYLEHAMLQIDTFNKLEELSSREKALGAYQAGASYFEEAGDTKTVEKKKSIIKRVWDAIAKVLTSIKEFIFGKTVIESIEDDAEGEIPEEYTKTTTLTKVTNAIKSVSKADIFKTVAAVLGALAIAKAAWAVHDNKKWKKIGLTGKQAKQLAKLYNTSTDAIQNAVKKIEGFDVDIAVESVNFNLMNIAHNDAIDKLTAIKKDRGKALDADGTQKARVLLDKVTKDWYDWRKTQSKDVVQYARVFSAEAGKVGASPNSLMDAFRSGISWFVQQLRNIAQTIVSAFKPKKKGGTP